MNNLFSRVMPFLIMGVMLFMLIVGLMFLYYALVFGAIIGLVLFSVAWLREKLFTPKTKDPSVTNKPTVGRTIDHNDL